MDKQIYIVASYNHTFIGSVIRGRAKLKFWNRYQGDCYSHISLSLDSSLENMMSFARKKLRNPFVSGLIRENIRSGIFALKPLHNRIAVMRIGISNSQYDELKKVMDGYWKRRKKLKYNFPGLASMLLFGRGIAVKDAYFCSQWVDEVLKRCGIDLFEGKPSCYIRPFDFYCRLEEFIVYEGLTAEYGGDE